MYSFDEEEQKLFLSDYNEVKLDYKLALKLAIFGGFIGLHHFYLKRWILGILSILFVYTFIPLIVGFVEAFTLKSTIREMNEEKAIGIANSINLRRKMKQYSADGPSDGAVLGTAPTAGVSKVTCQYCGRKVLSTATSCPSCGGDID
ncbi:MAG: NINE protein [Deltaproteobacteria bacterium]|nr:NINE protein [Deltaproteobacteria bacterium]